MLYDDGLIQIDDAALTIRRYNVLGRGERHVPFSSIRSIKRIERTRGYWRINGTGDFKHWFNYDRSRVTGKTVGFIINAGGWWRPVITPDDPNAVEAILREHLARGIDQ